MINGGTMRNQLKKNLEKEQKNQKNRKKENMTVEIN